MTPQEMTTLCRLVSLDRNAQQIAEDILLPGFDSLFVELTDLREAIDQIILGKAAEHRSIVGQRAARVGDLTADPKLRKMCSQVMGSNKISAVYPIGHCWKISRIVLNYLEYVISGNEVPYFSVLKHYINQGGLLKLIWGELRQEYLQTALQIGPLYVDLSNDTVDIHKPKTMWSSLNDSGFQNLSSFQVYAGLTQTYQGYDVYLNTCFPELACVCPLLVRKMSAPDNIGFSRNLFMAGMAMEKNWQPVEHLFENPQANGQLINSVDVADFPDFLPDLIRKSQHADLLVFNESGTVEPAMAAIHRLKKLSEKQQLQQFNRRWHLTHFLNWRFSSLEQIELTA
ncbi:Uncharacterised protein [BD1-7 clade bacterium]|uniref:Uncharacterized protein n=1 Tax=BD1-7 clade bacterium TaxID=2029982 RepID=A0A5S9N019_9GAMM|nr:Uncharacterised protein [BD1-7 clade bacterium]CAA0082881.1 Uncharacterised protein [BD1-7 clade bacterium]